MKTHPRVSYAKEIEFDESEKKQHDGFSKISFFGANFECIQTIER